MVISHIFCAILYVWMFYLDVFINVRIDLLWILPRYESTVPNSGIKYTSPYPVCFLVANFIIAIIFIFCVPILLTLFIDLFLVKGAQKGATPREGAGDFSAP